MKHSQTFDTTMSALVDLFFTIGSSRGKDLTAAFDAAYAEDSVLARKMLLWARDVRGGAGERQTIRTLLKHMEVNHKNDLMGLIQHIPTFGRWDDLLIFDDLDCKARAFTNIYIALKEGNGLCAKWMPRQGPVAAELRKGWGVTPKFWRKTLVNLTNVVEQKMCAGEWSEIEFDKLPSVASARYQKAFGKNAPVEYAAYKSKLEAGEAKINAGAIFCHDVIKGILYGDKVVGKAQWEALENFIGDNDVLPMLDVSGSMSIAVPGNPTLRVSDVANSIALYCADKNTGKFKDMIMSFTDRPALQEFKGNILQKLKDLNKMRVGYSTNVESAVAELLRVAKEHKVEQKDMPKTLLILSDMQFNMIGTFISATAFGSFQKQYEKAGYNMPKIVFWNLNASAGKNPVTAHESGAALVSGFSTAILKRVLASENMTPLSIMLDTLNDPRYAVV